MTGHPEPVENAVQGPAPEPSATPAAWPAAPPAQDPAGTQPEHMDSPAKGSRPWPVLGVLGGFALGLPVNALSDAFPGAFLSAVSVVLLLVVSAAYRLRRLDAGAPIHTLLPRVTLPLAGLAAVVSLFLDGQPANWAVLVAAALGVTGCLQPGPTNDPLQQLLSVALIALGVAMTGVGVSNLLDSPVTLAVAAMVAGMALIGFGISNLLDSPLLAGAAMVALGVALIGGGVSVLLDSRALVGVAAITLGVGAISAGAGALLDSRVLLGIAGVPGGVALISGGVGYSLGTWTLSGTALIALGIGMLGLGIGVVLDSGMLVGIAVIAGGVGAIGIGISFLLDFREVLSGVAAIAAGVAMIVGGASVVNAGRLVGWLRSLLAAPREQPGADLQQGHVGQGRTVGRDPAAPPD